MRHLSRSRLLLVFIALLVASCDGGPRVGESYAASAASPATADSLTTMPSLVRRFQAQSADAPTALAGGARSLPSLVSRYLTALEQRDTTSLESLRVTRSEFAHLYFPESVFMRPPYELDPAIVWLQLDAASRTGLRRSLAEYGGRPLRFVGLDCEAPDAQGVVRIHGCDVRRIVAGDTVRDRLFGAILERDGTFKFLSLQNRL